MRYGGLTIAQEEVHNYDVVSAAVAIEGRSGHATIPHLNLCSSSIFSDHERSMACLGMFPGSTIPNQSLLENHLIRSDNYCMHPSLRHPTPKADCDMFRIVLLRPFQYGKAVNRSAFIRAAMGLLWPFGWQAARNELSLHQFTICITTERPGFSQAAASVAASSRP